MYPQEPQQQGAVSRTETAWPMMPQTPDTMSACNPNAPASAELASAALQTPPHCLAALQCSTTVFITQPLASSTATWDSRSSHRHVLLLLCHLNKPASLHQPAWLSLASPPDLKLPTTAVALTSLPRD